MKQFCWTPAESPPPIESHSKAKLKVLASYLEKYFDTLNTRLGAEEFKLNLVDGFCGGGTYQSDNGEVLGSPLIMLEETRRAEQRINQNRTKPIHFNVKFHFIDKKKAHTDFLQLILKNRGYSLKQDQIEIHTDTFENVAKEIVQSVKKHQPRSGRSLFLLDQTGYSDVNFASIRHIFQELPNAEVILTFAVDALRNFAKSDPQFLKSLSPVELGELQVEEILEDDTRRGQGVLQRVLRNHILQRTQANFDTPFFIRPKYSRRALWFIHLSRHAKARDVMIERHWAVQNAFEHIGTGGFQMLGYDAILESPDAPLFNFTQYDEGRMRDELLEQTPQRLYQRIGTGSLSVKEIHELCAIKTAARCSDIVDIVTTLVKEGEFDVIRDNKRLQHPKRIKSLHQSDSIILPDTPVLPGFSRLNHSLKIPTSKSF